MININKIITFLMLIIFWVTQTEIVFAVDKKQILPVGNEVSEQEYPDSEKIAPFTKTHPLYADIKKDNEKTKTENQESIEKKELDKPVEKTKNVETAKKTNKNNKSDGNVKVIEGSVEKTIDVTLEDCIKFALGNNPQIRAAIEDVSAYDARIKLAWSNYFPTLGWTTNVSRNRNLLFADAIGSQDSVYTYYILGQISLSQLIYDFGVTQNKVTISKVNYKTAQENLTSVVNNIVNQTKNRYYGLLLAYEEERVREDNVSKFELFYNQAKAFYEIGSNPKVDVTIAEVNLSNAKLQLIQAKNAVNIAVANLNKVMGIDYNTTYNIQERLKFVPFEVTLDEAMKIANESRPDLKAAKLKVESARQSLKLTKKAYFPSLTFQGNIAEGGRGWTSNHGYSIGGYLDFPAVNGMKIYNQIKEARALYSKEMANAIETENAIQLEIQTAYLTLIEKKNQIPVATLGMKQAKENYEISAGRYKVGVSDPIEMKEAQVAYLNAQSTYYNALYEYNCAKSDLEKAIGRNLTYGEEVIELKPQKED